MDGPQRKMMATGQQQRQQQRQGMEEEERCSVDTLRDSLPSMRIQTQLSHPSSAPPSGQWQIGQHSSGGVAMGGGGGSSVLLSAQSDMSDRTVFDWQVQDPYHYYRPFMTPSSFPEGDDRHAKSGIEVRHGKDKDRWTPPPSLPLPLFTFSSQDAKHQHRQQQYLTTPYQQQQGRPWTSTIATLSRDWPSQTRRWLRRYLSITPGTTPTNHRHDQHLLFFASDHSPPASAFSSPSTSTLLGKEGFYSRHHPYFQGRRHFASTSSTSSPVNFLSLADIESAKQYKKEEDRYFWRSSLTLRWSFENFSLSFRLPRVWSCVFGRGRNRTSSATSPSSISSVCVRLFTRRRKRTLYKWTWMMSLLLVLTLAIYIAIVGISKIHGYFLVSGGDPGVAAGRTGDLVSRGRDVWKTVGMGKTWTVRNAGHGDGEGVGLVAEGLGTNSKTMTMKQDGGIPGSAISPLITAVEVVQDSSASVDSIWIRRARDEMGDPLDFYPDENEDDPSEAASFIVWLAQAPLITPTSQQQQGQQQPRRSPQQYQGYHEPSRPPPPPRRRQGEAAQESFLIEPERYFTYIPFAGISNQFYGMLRAMSIARALDRTLILPPITSSSHDKSRKNQAWSNFFDLNEFRRRTGLKVIEYQDLRDQGLFRGPTGVKKASAGEAAKATLSVDKRRGERYQRSLETGTGAVDMTMPCHVTCGFGSKRDLDFTAKAFIRQWGFQYKKEMLPNSSPASSPSTPPGSPVDNSPIDQTRDFDRIVKALQDDSLKGEGFLCVSNTYKIQISSAAIPASALVDSIEWHEFGQHLLFQPQLIQFVDEFLGRIFGRNPVERAKYGNDTFWISSLPLSGPWSQPTPTPLPEQVPAQESVPPQGESFQLQLLSQPMVMDVNNTLSPSPPPPSPPTYPQIPVSYAATVNLKPWPPLRPLIQHTFFMIHVRRGDFEAYCKKEFKDERLDQCLPSNEAYVRVINELQQRALRHGGGDDGGLGIYGNGKNDDPGHDPMLVEKEEAVGRSRSRSNRERRRIPVLVATNENRPEELAQLRQLGRTGKATRSTGMNNEEEAVAGGSVDYDVEGKEGEEWIILDHEEMQTVERLGVFGPMMVEQLLLAEAEALVGVRMSTFSRVGGYRQRDWYHRRILYM